jgi:hypothetical protein
MIESIWCSWRINTFCFQSRKFLKCVLRRNTLIILLRQTINFSRIEDVWKAFASRVTWLRIFQHLSQFELCFLIWWIRHIMFKTTTYLCFRDDCCCTYIRRMRIYLLNRFVDNWRNYENVVRAFNSDVLSDHSFVNEMRYCNEAQALNDNKTLMNISK